MQRIRRLMVLASVDGSALLFRLVHVRGASEINSRGVKLRYEIDVPAEAFSRLLMLNGRTVELMDERSPRRRWPQRLEPAGNLPCFELLLSLSGVLVLVLTHSQGRLTTHGMGSICDDYRARLFGAKRRGAVMCRVLK